eukprot:XP_011616161.1 PREDICTED: G1/S-specific cyclin-E1-like [Takifugu rubripes]
MSPLFSCASLTSWASKDVVWSNMLEKDKAYTRDVHMMEKHPHLQPKMRAILLDWLMEVSEVYKLHRETYHLAQDYFDRFMATQRNVFKSTLEFSNVVHLALKRAELEECVRWMVPFAMALREVGGASLKSFPGIPEDDVHNIQIHASYMAWLDKAYSYQDVDLEQHGNHPVPSGILTPPLSSEKTDEPVRADALKIRPRMCPASPQQSQGDAARTDEA